MRNHGPHDPAPYGGEQVSTLNGGCHPGELPYPCSDDQTSGFRHQLPVRCEDLSAPVCLGGWL